MSRKKQINKMWSLIYVIVPVLAVSLLILILGWEKICMRLISVFITLTGEIIIFTYGGVMRYPGPGDTGDFPKEQQHEITVKRKVMGPFVRVLLLGLAVFTAWGSIPFYKDVISVVFGKQGYETITGKVTGAETLYGCAPFYQSIELNGDKGGTYAYFYSFSGRFRAGEEYEFIFLKNSRFIVDDKKLPGKPGHKE